MSVHTIYHELLPLSDGVVEIGGEEARHAIRVKRCHEGDRVRLLDGQGHIVLGRVEAAGRSLRIRVERVESVAPITPAVEVCAAAPKGPRIDRMVDALCQVGASAWRPVEAARSVVEPRPQKLDRLQRIAAESSKQCGRAWTLAIGAPISFDSAISTGGNRVVIADQSGQPYTPTLQDRIRLLVGPEGGWTDEELSAARRAGAMICAFGVHAMRIEVAAPTCTAVILDQERRSRPESGEFVQREP